MHRHAALFLAALGWASLAVGGEVDVRLRLLSNEALEVAYTLPPGCASLAFVKDGDAGRATRAGWQALDGGVAGADRLERPAAAAGQPVLRFRVPADTRHIGYAAAFPMGQGLYVHLSNYAVAETCGPVRYRLAAPGIAVGGRAVRDAAGAPNGDTAALLLSAPLPSGAGVPVYVDPRLSAAVLASIHTVADGTVAYLHRELPDAAYTRPIVAVAWAEQPGGPNIDGDAADVLRLGLLNWPRNPGPAEDAQLTRLVSHEFSHRFQLRDAVEAYPDERLLHEGGGEFLRWMASVANGWMTPAQAGADLDQALSDCMLYTEGRSWRSLRPREIAVNWLAYRCGLPAYVYVLAARQDKGTAMQRFGGFYHELAAGPIQRWLMNAATRPAAGRAGWRRCWARTARWKIGGPRCCARPAWPGPCRPPRRRKMRWCCARWSSW